MSRAAVPIPEKLFFKIGEVCDITGVQAHVLRYWESEFPMLAPQKNRAGQRTYRKRDVEMALRIKELLYEDQYTIAGAKKKLTIDLRGASKLKVVTPEMTASAASVVPEVIITPTPPAPAPPSILPAEITTAASSLIVDALSPPPSFEQGVANKMPNYILTNEQQVAARSLKKQLSELLMLLDRNTPPQA